MRTMEVFGQPKYRTIDEARIVETLLLKGWRFEVAEGERATAEQAALASLDRCRALGLPYRTAPDGGRLFDPVEVANFLRWAHMHRGERTWEDRCVATGRRQAWTAHPNGGDWDQPPDPGALLPQRFAVTIRRTFNLGGRRPGERVRLRLPLPLEDSTLSDLSVEFLPPPRAPVETVIAPARLDASLATPEDGRASVGVRAAFTAKPPAPQQASSLDAAEAVLYTRPREGLISVSGRVRALAAELSGREQSGWAVMRRFWAFMLDELVSGSVHYDLLDPSAPLDWLLEHGWYDCRTGSALLVALCRARQIPARLVSGYLLHVAAPTFHTWMEAWIEGRGWLPFDLSCWDFSVGGRDAGWRDYYFGRLDHRMTVERPPRLFNGLGSIRLPAAWQMLVKLAEPGATVTFEDLDTGVLTYREDIEVQRLDPR